MRNDPSYNRAYYQAHKDEIKKNVSDRWAEVKADNEVWKRTLHRHARSRAAKRGVPLTITPDDIEIPTHCPYLGIQLTQGVGVASGSSASLDRIHNELGYVPGNVQVISNRANSMKQDASIEELILFAQSVLHIHRNEAD